MSATIRFSFPLACLTSLALLAGVARAETGRTTPGLVIETGARTAYCDQLLFSPDGTHLLAVGEDKVLRRWAVSAGGFLKAESINVRWPIQREARGSIFSVSYDRAGGRVAFAGYGLKTGLVATARLSPSGGEIESVCDPVPSPESNWAVSFSPDGRYVLYGNETGEVYRWEPGTKAMPTLFPTSKARSRTANRVRLLAFIGSQKFVTVTMDGAVREWDMTTPNAAPNLLHTFTGGSVYRAVLSPDKAKIAVGLTATSKTAGTAAGIQAARRVHLFNLRAKSTASLVLPDTDGTFAVRTLAFNSDSDRIAVGCNETPRLNKEDFLRLKGAQVFVYALGKPSKPAARMSLGFNVEALAFHPVRANLLASAGGDNHEVTLWDASTGEKLSDDAEVRGPANCIWDVALDKKGQYFAWKDRRSRDPKHPNHLAAGPWRVFDLAGPTGRQILPTPPADFAPVPAIDSVDGWDVKPTSVSGVWHVTGPGGVDVRLDDASGLYDRKFCQEPRCWTFIKSAGKPLKLAVGHQWGVSVYECRPGGVKRVRVMTGHEGQVMCVAPSADGNLLITGGRDQSICLWSLTQWPAGNEMGASFAVRGGKLEVTSVDPGSPAWEPLNPLDGTDNEINRLAKGDVIDILYIKSHDKDAGFVYDPLTLFETQVAMHRLLPVKHRTRNANEALALLKDIRPATEYILAKQRPGVKDLIYKLTTNRQRPLFRFFATRADNPGGGRDWVIWRPRDYYYDTSANGDRYVGWHVNAKDLDKPPEFYPLERYRGSDYVPGVKGEPSGFHRPDKIWPFIGRGGQDPTKVIFTEIEPPIVTLKLVELPKGARPVGGAKVAIGKEVVIEVRITSANLTAPDQLLKHVDIYLNDYKEQKVKLAAGLLDRLKPTTIRLPASDLLWGRNVVQVACVNARGGRGESNLKFDFEPAEKPSSNLYSLIVGINDYSKAKGTGDGVSDLLCAAKDAAEISRVLEQHTGSRNFFRSFPVLIPENEATTKNILAKLKEIGAKVKPGDTLVVYLAGHGSGEMVTDNSGAKSPKPGTFFYVTSDCDLKKPETVLTSKKLYDEIMKINCRKMLMLDTCHSGAAAKDAPLIPSDQLRDVTREGKRLLVLSSCQPSQLALEPAVPSARFKHGFFTHALLNIIADADKAGKRPRQEGVTLGDLNLALAKELTDLLKAIRVPEGVTQLPAFSDADPAGLSVLCRPLTPKSGGGERRKR